MTTLPAAIQTPASDQTLAPNRVLLATALGIFAVWAWWFRAATFDDVHVSFRYARHWAGGFGPSFNIGEAPSEGFSNPLLVWLSMLGITLGVEPTALARALALGCGAACILVADELMRWLGARSVARATGLAALVGCLPHTYWLATGTENGLFCLCLLLSMRNALRAEPARPRDAIAPVLLALTRPEGIGLAFVLLAARWSRMTITRRELQTAALVFSSYAVLLAWRYATFHRLVPNTITAKQGDAPAVALSHGLIDIARFAASYGYPMSVLAVLGAAVALRNRRAWVPLSGACVGLAFLLITGGDVNVPPLRFAVLYAPTVAILTALGANAIGARWNARSAHTLAALLIASNAALAVWASRAWLDPVWRSGNNFHGHFEIAGALRRAAPAGSTVALFDIGIMAYELPTFRIVDLTGLTDPFIASTPGTHFNRASKAVVDHVFAKAPDFMVLNSTRAERGNGQLEPEFPIGDALMKDPRFAAHYALAGVRHTRGPWYLAVFRRTTPR
jgi:hypothetical protein